MTFVSFFLLNTLSKSKKLGRGTDLRKTNIGFGLVSVSFLLLQNAALATVMNSLTLRKWKKIID